MNTDLKSFSPLRCQLGSWADWAEAASQIRFAVFVDEQGVPADMELDEEDDTAIHAIIFNADNLPIATARLIAPGRLPVEVDIPEAAARIGRMAVLSAYRGQGVGAFLLHAMIDAAIVQGWPIQALHAQQYAAGFYQKAGFVGVGQPFDEAGIAHIGMVRHTGG
ncbi:GNAT family N-acetyltransferase [Ampullimonas aquatilis]|uniref:GNAT family N-acetyltransferase n=1 Tax=Ampullimonas aquatilis TaxID=1341549 RepID=UPI003C74C920